jgi:hypothetical protein
MYGFVVPMPQWSRATSLSRSAAWIARLGCEYRPSHNRRPSMRSTPLTTLCAPHRVRPPSPRTRGMACHSRNLPRHAGRNTQPQSEGQDGRLKARHRGHGGAAHSRHCAASQRASERAYRKHGEGVQGGAELLQRLRDEKRGRAPQPRGLLVQPATQEPAHDVVRRREDDAAADTAVEPRCTGAVSKQRGGAAETSQATYACTTTSWAWGRGAHPAPSAPASGRRSRLPT